MRFQITEMDHIVLNVADIDRSLAFYTNVLGLPAEREDEWRAGKIGFPSVRINADTIIDLMAGPVLGAATGQKTQGNLNHFCMVVAGADLAPALGHLAANGVAVHNGPVSRWGAHGRATSVYLLDPDGNEVELRCYGSD
ncbi:MAG: VOC family virulence protein [Dehalococcoidia bacterium]|nr:VOC family virulence protein [Dehalococcoidia bacterium]